jgi:hypothetical protein
MKHFALVIIILFMGAVPPLYAQSTSEPGIDTGSEEQSVENEGAVSRSVIYTMTTGAGERTGRVMISSLGAAARDASNNLEQEMAFHSPPLSFVLDQNYPNPFNPSTTISFTLPGPAVVRLNVFNILGQEVRTLLNLVTLEEGEQSIKFDASSLPSGVYFYRIVVQTQLGEDAATVGRSFASVGKMVVQK